MHAVRRRLGARLVFLLRGDESLYGRLVGIKWLHHGDRDGAFSKRTGELEGLRIAERVVTAELRSPAEIVGLAHDESGIFRNAEEDDVLYAGRFRLRDDAREV